MHSSAPLGLNSDALNVWSLQETRGNASLFCSCHYLFFGAEYFMCHRRSLENIFFSLDYNKIYALFLFSIITIAVIKYYIY